MSRSSIPQPHLTSMSFGVESHSTREPAYVREDTLSVVPLHETRVRSIFRWAPKVVSTYGFAVQSRFDDARKNEQMEEECTVLQTQGSATAFRNTFAAAYLEVEAEFKSVESMM